MLLRILEVEIHYGSDMALKAGRADRDELINQLQNGKSLTSCIFLNILISIQFSVRCT